MDFNIIAVDFDGTLCENKWPEIGEPNNELIAYLKKRQEAGDKLILWTCRTNYRLAEAVYWCGKHDLYFDAVNENLRETLEWMHGDSRKIFADEYIDDRSLLFIPGFADAERAELSGRMIDIIEDWLERKGAATDDEAIIKGDDYDYLAEQFAVALGIYRDCTEE